MLLKIGNKEINCKIKYKKTRHAYLKLNPNYCLEITLPENRSVSAEMVLKEKQNWLKRKVGELEKSVKLFEGDSIYYKGKKYNINVVKDRCSGIKIFDNSIEICKFGKRKTENILLEFLADETLEYVSVKAEEFSNIFGLYPKSVSIKNLRSFGHCKRDGKIFFNSKLICLPVPLIDYVVAHELVHLKHFNHSKDFKLGVEKILPNYKELEKELKRYYW